MSTALPSPILTLANGTRMPQFGIGTYKVADADATQPVLDALELGYRLVDTATMYGNELGVGRALAESGLPREEIFVTTKLNNTDHEPAVARDAFARSLDDLGLDRVDLYLIHWPMAKTTDMAATWQTLIDLLGTGRVDAIGVSNYTADNLRTIIAATGIVPAVNQVEINPYFAQNPLRALHAELGIVTQGWSPLARGAAVNDPVIQQIATRLGRTPSQVVLRWHLQRGDGLIPKSTHRDRIAENAQIFNFELPDADMAAISTLDVGRRSGSAPENVELGNR